MCQRYIRVAYSGVSTKILLITDKSDFLQKYINPTTELPLGVKLYTSDNSHIISFYSTLQKSWGRVISPTLQMRKIRLKEVTDKLQDGSMPSGSKI